MANVLDSNKRRFK